MLSQDCSEYFEFSRWLFLQNFVLDNLIWTRALFVRFDVDGCNGRSGLTVCHRCSLSSPSAGSTAVALEDMWTLAALEWGSHYHGVQYKKPTAGYGYMVELLIFIVRPILKASFWSCTFHYCHTFALGQQNTDHFPSLIDIDNMYPLWAICGSKFADTSHSIAAIVLTYSLLYAFTCVLLCQVEWWWMEPN